MEKCTPGVYFFPLMSLCSRGSVTSGAPRPAPHAGSRGSANTETTEGSGGSLDGRNTSCLLVTNTTPSYAYGVSGKQGSGLTHAQVLVFSTGALSFPLRIRRSGPKGYRPHVKQQVCSSCPFPGNRTSPGDSSSLLQ